VSPLAKGTPLVLPLVLLVHALLVRRDDATTRRRLAPVAPYAFVALAMGIAHYLVGRSEGTVRPGDGPSLESLLIVDLEVAGRYVMSLVAPFAQSVEHGVKAESVDASHARLGAFAIVVWCVALAATWKRSRVVAAVLLAVPL